MTDTEGYFENQRTWAQDAISSGRKSKRLAWTIAIIALVLAGLQAVVIFAMLPLKTKEMVPVLVDRTTGFTQVLEADGAQVLRADESLIQSLLAQYVVGRERLDPALINRDYRRTALWSSGSARQSYMRLMSKQNPESPLQRLSADESLSVTIKSVSQVAPGQALVRFDTIHSNVIGGENPAGAWIAAISYEFVDAPMNFDDRLLNPLGLQVKTYRRDPERPEQIIEVETQNLEVSSAIEDGDALPEQGFVD